MGTSSLCPQHQLHAQNQLHAQELCHRDYWHLGCLSATEGDPAAAQAGKLPQI